MTAALETGLPDLRHRDVAGPAGAVEADAGAVSEQWRYAPGSVLVIRDDAGNAPLHQRRRRRRRMTMSGCAARRRRSLLRRASSAGEETKAAADDVTAAVAELKELNALLAHQLDA